MRSIDNITINRCVWANILIVGLVFSQSLSTVESFELTIKLGSKSANQTHQTICEITLTNTSGRSLHVLQPGKGGMLENLRFMVLVEGEDTAFVDVNPDLAASLQEGGKGTQLMSLKANESLSCTVDLFSGAYGITLPPGKGFEVQAIYMSVYRTGNPNVEARAAV